MSEIEYFDEVTDLFEAIQFTIRMVRSTTDFFEEFREGDPEEFNRLDVQSINALRDLKAYTELLSAELQKTLDAKNCEPCRI